MSRTGILTLAILLTANVGTARPPSPEPDPNRPHEPANPDDSLPKESIDRVSQWFRVSKLPTDDRDLIGMFLRKVQENPGKDFGAIGQELIKEHPELSSNPQVSIKRLERLQKVLWPNGTPPTMPTPGSRPTPPFSGPMQPPKPLDPDLPPNVVEPQPPREIPIEPVDPPVVREPFRPNKHGIPPEHPFSRPGGFPKGMFPPRGEGPAHRRNAWPEPGPTEDDILRKDKKLAKFLTLWEKNFGPIGESPAVRSMILELLNSSSGSPDNPVNGLMEMLNDPNTSGEDVSKWLDEQGGPVKGGWELPDLGLKDWNWGGGNLQTPDLGSAGSSSGSSWFSGSASSSSSDSWLPVVMFLVTAAGALVLWRYWPYLSGKMGLGTPQPIPGLGPWPVDPRTIADRDALVKAFEYLSVLVCGTGARVWNHVTIATALGRAVGAAGEEAAEPLARLYAVARYTAVDEPLPPEIFGEARHHLSRLARVPTP